IKVEHDKEVSRTIRSYRVSGLVFNKLIERNFIGSTSFVLLRRKALETCGYFNEKMESAQDYELWLRISKDYEVDYVNIPLVKYYAHDGDRISTNNNKKIQGLEELNNINLWYLRDNPKKYNIRKTRIIPYYYKKDGYIKALIK